MHLRLIVGVVGILGDDGLALLLRRLLGFVAVDGIETLGLDHAVNESAAESSDQLLSLSVRVGGTVRSDMVLVGLGRLVGGSSSEELVGQLSLVGRAGDLVVGVLVRVISEPTHYDV